MSPKTLFCMTAVLIFAAPFLVSCEDEPASTVKTESVKESGDDEYITTESGLKYKVIVKGKDGPRPGPAAEITVHYRGKLEDGTEFDSSHRRGRPVTQNLWEVIPGWKEGLQLMTAGSTFEFIIPPELAYGQQGLSRLIPPNSTLYFEVELVDFKPGPKMPEFHEGNPEKQQKTESGLVWEVIVPGKGDNPKEGDTVKVHYGIWSTKGEMRFCTEMKGTSFPIPVGKIRFKILDEGLRLLKEGARNRYVVPPELAFGDQGMGALVAPGETTIWEIELVQIMRPLPVPEFSLSPEDAVIVTESGLKYEVVREGQGNSPKMGQEVTVHYAGWLEDGTLFDNSFERGDTTSFRLGQVIAGWNEGLQLMKPGAIYKFTIPGNLGYGERGSPPKIPANATLIFHVELFEFSD